MFPALGALLVVPHIRPGHLLFTSDHMSWTCLPKVGSQDWDCSQAFQVSLHWHRRHVRASSEERGPSTAALRPRGLSTPCQRRVGEVWDRISGGEQAAPWLWVMQEHWPELWRACGGGTGLGGLSLFWLADPLGNPGSFQAESLVGESSREGHC